MRNVIPPVVALLAATLAFSPPFASASPEILAEAGFEEDAVGATVPPSGGTLVVEDLYDDSTSSGGVSAVEAFQQAKRYRLSDAGTGAVRGIRAPLSTQAETGDITMECVVTAEQTNADAAIWLATPQEDEWILRAGFGSDGKFAVHGAGSSVSYSTGTRYRIVATLRRGSACTADYSVTDLSTDTVVLSATGLSVSGSPTAHCVRLRTGASTDGSYSLDDLLVTR